MRSVKVAVIIREEDPVMDRSIRKFHPLELRDIERRSDFHEMGIDSDGPIRNQRASRASQAVSGAGDAEAVFAKARQIAE